MDENIHEIDGKTLEGGGQVVRISVGVSAISGKPIRISQIRGGRPRGGGLKNQHLTAINWLANACAADMVGANLRSNTLEFKPMRKQTREPTPQNSLNIDQNTPGAIALILQAVLPFVIFSGVWTEPVKITIRGGTNVSFSPSYDYVKQVLLPTLARIGLPFISSRLHCRGWSTGQTKIGSATFTVTPLAAGHVLQGFVLCDRGEVSKVSATVLAPGMCSSAFTRELHNILPKKGLDVPIEVSFQDSLHPKRMYLLLIAHTSNGYFLGRDLLYFRKIPSPLAVIHGLIEEVTDQLLEELAAGGCVDEYMQDQLVIFQALAKGRSVVDAGEKRKPSLHTRTAWWITEELLGVKFHANGSCEGHGIIAGSSFHSKTEGAISHLEDLVGNFAELRT